jgi:hypothetical protein
MLRSATSFLAILRRHARAGAAARPLPVPGVRDALAASGSSPKWKQRARFAGDPLHSLPYADPLRVRVEALALGDTAAIMARTASARSGAVPARLQRCSDKSPCGRVGRKGRFDDAALCCARRKPKGSCQRTAVLMHTELGAKSGRTRHWSARRICEVHKHLPNRDRDLHRWFEEYGIQPVKQA